MIRFLRAVVTALAVLALGLTAAPLATATTPARTSIDCARMPYGVTGCEAYLGKLVRQREGLKLPDTSDEKLGRVIRRLCFGDDHETLRLGPDDAQLKRNLSLVRRVAVPKYCG